MSEHNSDGWEVVHTVNDYYDGPRRGVANFRCIPHAYRCAWNDAADDWSEVFALSPIDTAQLRLVEEEWSIWRRWKAAQDAGQLGQDDHHPALAADRGRYDQLQSQVAAALQVDEANAVQATPEFRGTMEPLHALEVRWTLV